MSNKQKQLKTNTMNVTNHNIEVYRKQLVTELENTEKGTERYFSLTKVLQENK